mgnify:CR=1 FL=1
MSTKNLNTRTSAIKGDLVGEHVQVAVPYSGGQYAEVGTVTRVALPLVEVDTGGDTIRYRHIDNIQLT